MGVVWSVVRPTLYHKGVGVVVGRPSYTLYHKGVRVGRVIHIARQRGNRYPVVVLATHLIPHTSLQVWRCHSIVSRHCLSTNTAPPYKSVGGAWFRIETLSYILHSKTAKAGAFLTFKS